LYGIPPFNDSSPTEVFDNIINGRYKFLDEIEVSEEARDLIRKLLTLDPEERLGTASIDDIKEHPFFTGVNWRALCKSPGLFIPQTDDIADTAYFDDRGVDEFKAEEEPELTADMEEAKKENEFGITVAIPTTVLSPEYESLESSIPQSPLVDTSTHLQPEQPFGNFTYKNLSLLEQVNQQVLQDIQSRPFFKRRVSTSVSQCFSGSQLDFTAPPRSPSVDLTAVKPANDYLKRPVPYECLIAEDNPVSSKMIVALLQKLNVNCTVTVDGHEALLHALNTAKYDIIFLDYQMPFVNGTRAAQIIRFIDNVNISTPLISVTAYTTPENASIYDGILNKPITKQKLESVLSRWLVYDEQQE
jgi:CheY-like chemotaxis protein